MPFVIDLKLNKIATTLFEKKNEYFYILSTRGLSLILTQASAFNKTKISR